MLDRMTGRATLVEAEPIRDAILGAMRRAEAIVKLWWWRGVRGSVCVKRQRKTKVWSRERRKRWIKCCLLMR
jgi:hypothetical protein